jgi:hypothetical protein
MKTTYFIAMLIAIMGIMACNKGSSVREGSTPDPETEARLARYTKVRLTTDLSALSESDKKVIPILIEAAKIMDGIFWQEAYGDPATLLDTLKDVGMKEFVRINYGPWDRLDGNKAFVTGAGEKPKGANYYPHDMTKAEFESADVEGKQSLYTLIRRDDAGQLVAIPYHEAFAAEHRRAADLLLMASTLTADEGFKNYLKLRSEALLNSEYQPSDFAWLAMKDNTLDFVVGPIETYEDQLFGYKASHEAYVLVKDKAWSAKLARFSQFLPELQTGLPVPDAYKQEEPGTDAELNAYDVVYYAGDCNAGSKTIAINLPNDEEVQLKSGTRRLQLKNAMRAKFDKILLPISEVLIAEDQRKHITFDAFFANTMFHEVAHGLGIKQTLDGSATVREALKEHASAIEEGKADILGIYMVTQLFDKGEITEGVLEDYYVTFLASVFRSVRFGASSAHGKANMLRFYFFEEMGAFSRDPENGTYRVDFDKMRDAIAALGGRILTLQGDGDYAGAASWIAEKGRIGADLQADLNRLEAASIPVDVVFEQGAEAMGL